VVISIVLISIIIVVTVFYIRRTGRRNRVVLHETEPKSISDNASRVQYANASEVREAYEEEMRTRTLYANATAVSMQDQSPTGNVEAQYANGSALTNPSSHD
jgi:hypothetical protein